MKRSDIEALVERWLDIVRTGNVTLFEEILSENVRDDSAAVPSYGVETFKLRALALHRAFSDLQTSLDELVVDVQNSRIAWRWSVHATHTGEFAGIAATGRRITLRGVNIQRIESKRIVEHFSIADTSALLASLRAE
jgi:predicted ester cyclase